MSESNTAVERAAAAVAVLGQRQRQSRPQQRARQDGGQPEHAVRRHAGGGSPPCRGKEIALRMWQNMANGGALTFEVNGTLDLQDRQALEAAKPIFRWAAENEQYYAGQQSAARVLLLGASQKTGRSLQAGTRIAACSGCSAKNTSRSPFPTIWMACQTQIRSGDCHGMGPFRVTSVRRKGWQSIAGELSCAGLPGARGGSHTKAM